MSKGVNNELYKCKEMHTTELIEQWPTIDSVNQTT